MESIGTIIAVVLVVYSVGKTLWIASSKKGGTILGYDLEVLGDKHAKEFQNFITNLLTTLTFFFGMILYIVDIYTEWGLYTGIFFVVAIGLLDYYFIKKLFPREYKRIRG